jgi:hypothetical protein
MSSDVDVHFQGIVTVLGNAWKDWNLEPGRIDFLAIALSEKCPDFLCDSMR